MSEGTKVWIAIGALLLCLVAIGHCSTTPKKSNTTCWLPEGCVTQYTDNPLIYKAGSIAPNGDAVSDIDGNLNIRIKPLNTYMLYDESILFCGLPTEMFNGKTEPFVLTYERVSHHSVRGVGCHELVAVHSLKTEKMK